MQRYQTGDHALVREMNLSSVLGYLWSGGPLSRAQLASSTGLNKSTVSSLVDELIVRELLRETGLDTSGTGRPATLLELNPQAGCIIGVELGVDFVSIILADFTGVVLWRGIEATDSREPKEIVISQTLHLVDKAIQVAQTCSTRILGIGLTLPGLVDVENGILTFSPNLQWREVPLGQMYREHTGLPVFVDNDANAAVLGEHLFGVARNAQNFIFVIAGVGVGGGLFLNGEIYRGAGGFAGEIGHSSLMIEQNRPCRCGNRGCWENFANQYSLIERVRARLEVGRRSLITRLLAEHNVPLSLAVIAEAADAGDSEALDALKETGAAIGLGIANLVNIFNPEMVIVGGAMSQVGKYLLFAIQSVVEERSIAEARQQVKVVLSAFGTDASVMGAVAMVVKDILANPSRVKRELA